MQESFLSKLAESVPMAITAIGVAIAGLVLWFEPQFSESEHRINALEKELGEYKDTISSVSKKLSAAQQTEQKFNYLIVSGDLQVEGNKWADNGFKSQLATGNAAPVSCPEGQFVRAIRLVDRDNGKYCVECITNIEIYCSGL